MATLQNIKIYLNYENSLASKMLDTDTTFTLTNGTDVDGGALSGYYFFTFDEGTISEEHILATVAGTAGTVVTRGVSRVDGTSTVAANKKEHARGATVKITDAPLSLLMRVLNGTDTFNSVNWTGVNSIAGLATPTAGETTKAANVDYVNAIVVAGVNNGTETVKGIYETATSAESQNATSDTGGTGATLVVKPSDIAKNTQNQRFIYATTGGVANTYTLTLTPALTAYTAGQRFSFLVSASCTGASTLNINSLGAKNIQRYVSGVLVALANNDLVANMVVEVIYDGTRFVLQTPVATSMSTAEMIETQTFFNATDITGAEAETLTSATTSNADTLHTHNNLAFFTGVGASLVHKTYYNFYLPLARFNMVSPFTYTNVDAGTIWFWNYMARFSPSGAVASSIITATTLFPGISETTKDIITEYSCLLDSVGSNDVAHGLMTTIAPTTAYNDSSQKAACFTVSSAGLLYAHTSNGTGGADHTETQITGITLTNMNTYRIELNPTVDAKFYVNGVLKATITTNVPTTTVGYWGYGQKTPSTSFVNQMTMPFFSVEK